MNKTAVISNVIISVILNLLFGAALIVAGVLVIIYPQIFGVVLNAAFALIGLILILSSIPNLISGIASIKQKKGVFDLIFSLVTMLLGACFAFYGVCMIIMTTVIMSLPAELIGTVFTVGSILRWVLGVLIALYLLVLPIIRIVKAENKFMQFKAELVKMILGVVILILLFCGLLFSVLNKFIGIVLIAIGALTVLLAIAHLIIGLIGLGKKGPKAEVVSVADVDGDGKADAVLVDTDGDGKADAILVDTDSDGRVDTVLADTDGDGEIDAMAMDVDGDGTLDAVAVAVDAPAQEAAPAEQAAPAEESTEA